MYPINKHQKSRQLLYLHKLKVINYNVFTSCLNSFSASKVGTAKRSSCVSILLLITEIDLLVISENGSIIQSPVLISHGRAGLHCLHCIQDSSRAGWKFPWGYFISRWKSNQPCKKLPSPGGRIGYGKGSRSKSTHLWA